MGIKNGLAFRLAEIGKIKIGYRGKEIESKNGKKFCPPKKLDYFVVTTTERSRETGNFVKDEKVMAKLPAEPKELSIRLPFDDIDLNFFTSFCRYEGNKCICRGDGETAELLTGDARTKIECDPGTCKFLQDEKCKPTGILSCFLAENMEIGGVYKFRTHSRNSVSAIKSSLEYFADKTNGILQGLPLVLKLVKKTTEKHGTIAFATIVLDVEIIKFRELALRELRARKMLSVNTKLIEDTARESGFGTDTDPPEEIQAEFYPEAPTEIEVTPEAQKTIKAIEKKKKDIADRVAEKVKMPDKQADPKPAEKKEPDPADENEAPKEPGHEEELELF